MLCSTFIVANDFLRWSKFCKPELSICLYDLNSLCEGPDTVVDANILQSPIIEIVYIGPPRSSILCAVSSTTQGRR